jgi:hypothetical protein
MRITPLILIAVSLLWIGRIVPLSEAATTFNGSTIVGIDEGHRTVTFRARDGKQWTLPVKDPTLLKKEQVAAGDQVSIEIDLNDTIIKILKNPDQPQGGGLGQ